MRADLRWIRLTLCLVFLCAAIAVTAVSSLTDNLRVCEAAPEMQNGVVCRPLTIKDAPVVLLTATALLFVLPDLKRLNVSGLVDIEMRDSRSIRIRQHNTRKRAVVADRCKNI
jgi:hypothetical protein